MWFRKKKDNKHPLDFEHLCCFHHQIAKIGEGIKHGNGELIRVPMKSGKIAVYKLTSERYNVVFEDTGQRNWFFKFIGYE